MLMNLKKNLYRLNYCHSVVIYDGIRTLLLLLLVFGLTVVVGRLVVVDLAVCLLSFGFEVAAAVDFVLLAAS